MARIVQCPICPEGLPWNWAAICRHVHLAHVSLGLEQRLAALQGLTDRWPGEEVPVSVPACEVSGCDRPGTYENFEGVRLCSPCSNGEPTEAEARQQREELEALIRSNNEGLSRARTELDEIKGALLSVGERVSGIGRELDRPEYVRRATLNQVLDALIDAKQNEAAVLVMRMIGLAK